MINEPVFCITSLHSSLASADKGIPLFAEIHDASGSVQLTDYFRWWLATRIQALSGMGVLAGTPVYLNGYAAIPMVARLVEMGMGQGAAIAFMTAGAVTCIPAMAGVLALAKANLFAWYLTLCVLGALLTGYAYQLWLM